MSPEQARGEPVGHHSDLWSFGVVVYEMLTGQLPFKGDYEQAVIYSILNEQPEPLADTRRDVPEFLHRIVLKLLSKEAETRYHTTADLVSDLNRARSSSVGSYVGTPKHKNRPYVLTGIGIAFVVAIIVFFSQDALNFFGTKEIPPIDVTALQWTKSIAVLPFSDLSQAKDQEYFCDGMTEQIISNLSHLQDLKVIARTSVMTLKGSNKTVSEIGKELSVSYVLEGSIRKAGDRIRVTAQLIKVDDSTNLWANDYDREVQDIFGVQDDVSQAIANALFKQLSPNEAHAIRTQQTKDVAAYEYNLKGRYFHYTKFLNFLRDEDFKRSEEMFLKAIERDSTYGLAYAGLADLYDTYLRHLPANEKYDMLRQEYVARAFQLDPHSEFVNAAKGWVAWGKGDYEVAHESMNRALEINPNDAYVHLSMALLLDHLGLHHQTIAYLTRAIALDPLFASSYWPRGISYQVIGQFEKATQDYQRALEIEPEHLIALNSLAEQAILMKRFDEASEFLARCEKINPDYLRNRISAAWLHAAKGDQAKALSKHEDEIVYILLGMKDQAIRQLYKQHEQGWPLGFTGPRYGNYLSLRNLAIYDSLRDDPRFVEILEKEKRRYEEHLSKYGG
jgi:TolB-like protein/Tfp pilus assembly protein PilF